jgi:hypothetical protein
MCLLGLSDSVRIQAFGGLLIVTGLVPWLDFPGIVGRERERAERESQTDGWEQDNLRTRPTRLTIKWHGRAVGHFEDGQLEAWAYGHWKMKGRWVPFDRPKTVAFLQALNDADQLEVTYDLQGRRANALFTLRPDGDAWLVTFH